MFPRLIRIRRIQWNYLLFICFRLEIPFLGKFNPKNKNCQLKLKLKYNQFKYAQFNGGVHFFFFCFRPGIFVLGKSGPKNQICQFKLTFVTRLYRICRIQWWFPFFLCFRPHIPFFVQIGPKKSKLLFKQKLST